MLLSDGEYCHSCMLATQLAELVHTEQLKDNCIVALNDYICNLMANKKCAVGLGEERRGHRWQLRSARSGSSPAAVALRFWLCWPSAALSPCSPHLLPTLTPCRIIIVLNLQVLQKDAAKIGNPQHYDKVFPNGPPGGEGGAVGGPPPQQQAPPQQPQYGGPPQGGYNAGGGYGAAPQQGGGYGNAGGYGGPPPNQGALGWACV